ncbi:MAG: hypothetical protein IJF03_08385 [Lachnospiraceae bacterium]|nr:hypothetical protein [Lachnospiraceae bacterium]
MTGEERERYTAYLKNKKIAILTLEHKWHKLFPQGNKPAAIASLEEEVNECVKHEGGLRTDIKDLKKLKKKLMDGIVSNMGDTESKEQIKKMEESQRLILEINEKLENYESELLELSPKLKTANTALMLETMDYCYKQMHENADDIKEIAEWIKNIRIELKKNVLRKQDKELRNKMMYTYMHNIFGPEVIDIFDLESNDEIE